MNKKILMTGLTVAVLSATVLLTSTKVSAQTSQGPTSSIVQKIADRFGLSKSDVQAVFDQNRAENKAAMQGKFEAQLDQDVADGKITEAQKQLIISKRKEFATTRQKQMENRQGKSKENMEAERKSLEDWAKQNGIDAKYLMGGFGKHGGSPGGFKRPGQ